MLLLAVAADAGRLGWMKTAASRSLAAVGKPDPKCKTGVLSLDSKVCCAGYCGDCSDYPTCHNIRGQDSTSTCCKSVIEERECGNGKASADDCVQSCSEATP